MKNSLISKAINYYGGKALWEKAKFIEAQVSTKGLAFTLKKRPNFENVTLFMKVDNPYCKITPIGKTSNITGVLDNRDVKLQDKDGNTIEKRDNAREYFGLNRRVFYWDDLDMSYFANYAFWNYFTFPALLLNKSILYEELEKDILKATFPNTIPTHSKEQYFYFENGKLSSHHYTADVISKFANAVHSIKKHTTFNGIQVPSKRIVTPKFGKIILKKPVLIDITVHSFKLLDKDLNVIYN